jgi:hypothetical protein
VVNVNYKVFRKHCQDGTETIILDYPDATGVVLGYRQLDQQEVNFQLTANITTTQISISSDVPLPEGTLYVAVIIGDDSPDPPEPEELIYEDFEDWPI